MKQLMHRHSLPARRVLRTLFVVAVSLLLGSSACMSPTEPDTPRLRITEPSKYFLRTYNLTKTQDTEIGYDVRVLADGGFIITGGATMAQSSSVDAFLLRTNSEGQELWWKTYGGIGEDEGASVIETTDGGFVFAGKTSTFTTGKSDIWIMKTDANGTAIWYTNIGLKEFDEATDIIQCANGDYLIIGRLEDPLNGRSYMYLRRFGDLDLVRWEYRPEGTGQDYGTAVVETDDGSIVATGKTLDRDSGIPTIWLHKISAAGDSVIWDRQISSPTALEAIDMVLADDGGFAIAGNGTPGGNTKDMLFIKADAHGVMTTKRVLHTDAFAQSIQRCDDGGYILCGYSSPHEQQRSDIILVRLDAGGNVTWKKVIGGQHMDRAFATAVAPDGGFLITGSTLSYGSGTPDLLLIKTDASGQFEQ